MKARETRERRARPKCQTCCVYGFSDDWESSRGRGPAVSVSYPTSPPPPTTPPNKTPTKNQKHSRRFKGVVCERDWEAENRLPPAHRIHPWVAHHRPPNSPRWRPEDGRPHGRVRPRIRLTRSSPALRRRVRYSSQQGLIWLSRQGRRRSRMQQQERSKARPARCWRRCEPERRPKLGRRMASLEARLGSSPASSP